ncbi:hypothetical protein E8E12_001761 [Didymella heteroderae]|uniref:Heterokaryon incompatibility domain-containing protein n=1 Tax=Didymella heteroderae TaxID=1769908 RepID=A0A9P4WGR7_9PLEO|nr:hypothetical protein E8E12_001761 [Didymella heteroderae]
MVNDDYCLLIGKNLASFLQHIRDTERPSETMWIDAICINQADIRERNIHVVKMGDIYRKADKVIVWLGPQYDDSDLALQLLKTMEALGDHKNLENQRRDWACEHLPHGKDLLHACNPGRTLLWMRSNREKGNRDLVQLLYHLRPSQSSDPKDKVYGVLGLASDGRAMVPQARYELDVVQIYAKLYQTMSEVRGNLDWLTLATGVANPQLPSWCADLTKQSRYVSMNTCRSVLGKVQFGFRATGESKPEISIDPDSLRCVVKGYIFDEIDGMGGCQDFRDPTDELLQPSTNVSAYSPNAAVLEAIWMTLVADQDFEGTAHAWRAPSKFGTFYVKEAQMILSDLNTNELALKDPSAFQIWVQRNAALIIGGQTVAERTIAASISEPVDTSALAGFHRRLQSTVKNRRFIITTKGYVGIANDDVRSGDKVCLLSGGRMPVILRPEGKDFVFLGEAYVHGMMQGELWPCADLPGVEAREFSVL